MSKPQYAFRIWRVWDTEGGPVVTSATPRRLPAGQDVGDYHSWDSKTLVATCNIKRRLHPAPQLDCECGIYAYPDWLDAVQLLGKYAIGCRYALGLISGYAGAHNDGTIVGHDACVRFAEADIVGFAKVGSAWRTGRLDQLGKRMAVPLWSLEEMFAEAAKGQEWKRKSAQDAGYRYLEDVSAGEEVSMAWSGVIADQKGALFIRNDREVREATAARGRWLVRKNHASAYKVGHSTGSWDRFEVSHTAGSGIKLLKLPFDGDGSFSSPGTRLAGRVSSIRVTQMDSEEPLTSIDNFGDHAVRLPGENLRTPTDFMDVGERIQVNPAAVSIDTHGFVWIARVLDHPENAAGPTCWIQRIAEKAYAVELKGRSSCELVMPQIGRPNGIHWLFDTQADDVTIDGMHLPGAQIPQAWVTSASDGHVRIRGHAFEGVG